MQVKLYEFDNSIEFIYKDHSTSLGSSSAQIGLNGNPSAPWGFTYTQTVGLSSSTPGNDYRYVPAPIPPPPGQLSLQPKSLNFGSLTQSQSNTLCVTLKSVGVSTLKILGAGIAGSADFSIVSGPRVNDSFLVGQTGQYCIRFSPLTAGTRTATFILQTSGQDSGTQQVTLTGVGIAPAINVTTTSIFRKTNTPIGKSTTVTFPVQSTGTGALTFNSITVAGANADQYAITRMPMNPLPAGSVDSIGVTFSPTFEGRGDASIVINTNALNLPTITIPTFGVGILPRLTLSPSTIRFDSVRIGDSVCQLLTLSNPGTDTVRILRNTFTSADYDFSYYGISGSDTVIAPSQSRTVNVCFKPLRNGTRTAVIRFLTNIPLTYETTRRDTSQFVVNVSGVGVPSGILAVGGTLFDTSMVGVEHCVSDTIYNTGGADVVVTSATVTGGDATNFAINNVTFPFTLAGGASKVVNVCFTPSARGVRSTSIVLSGTTGGRATTMTVPLAGYGLEACAQPSATALFDARKTLVTSMDTAIVTITNCGNMPATYTGAITQTGSSYTLVGPASTGVIAPGSTADFTVTFAPGSIGTAAGTLTVTGGPTPIPVTLGGVGGGVIASATGSAGNVSLGDCREFDVTVTNNGNVDWTPGTPTITGANYTVVSGPTPSTITAGNAGVVRVKYCPSAMTTETAELTFPSASPSAIGGFTYTLTGSGAQSGVSQTVAQNGYVLDQNYPNPLRLGANTSTEVRFVLATSGAARLELVDQTGAVVKTVLNERMTAGEHSVSVDAKDLVSGTYFYVLTSGDVRLVKQMVVVK